MAMTRNTVVVRPSNEQPLTSVVRKLLYETHNRSAMARLIEWTQSQMSTFISNKDRGLSSKTVDRLMVRHGVTWDQVYALFTDEDGNRIDPTLPKEEEVEAS